MALDGAVSFPFTGTPRRRASGPKVAAFTEFLPAAVGTRTNVFTLATSASMGGARRLATFCGPVSLRPIRSGDDPIDATRTYPDVKHAWNNQNVASVPRTVRRPLR